MTYDHEAIVFMHEVSSDNQFLVAQVVSGRLRNNPNSAFEKQLGPHQNMKYRADIDGLRAIAVLPVVLFHAGLTPLTGGFAGVNVFFVISGYLITKIIYSEIQNKQFSIAVFYQKRADRLFPVLISVLLVVGITGYLASPPSEYKSILKSIFSAGTFTSNIFFWKTQDYFSASAFTLPLLHTWSLGVEEQFYIFFPIYLIIAHKLKLIKQAVILALIASFSLSVVFIEKSTSATFYLLPFRAWELMVGSCIALGMIPTIRSKRTANYLAVTGTALLAFTYFSFSKDTLFPGYNAIYPTLGAALIILSGEQGDSFISKILKHGPLVLTGKSSYSIYMWHWPIFVFYGLIFDYPDSNLEKILLVALALAVGFLSWKYIEGLTRGKLAKLSFRKTAFISISAFSPILIICIMGIMSAGMPWRVGAASQQVEKFSHDYSAYRKTCHLDDKFYRQYSDTCILGSPNTQPDTIVWGDSHGVEIAAALAEHFEKTNRSLRQITYSSCTPAIGIDQIGRKNCKQHNSDTLSKILADTSIKNIILLAYYSSDLKKFSAFEQGYSATVDALSASGKKVVVSYALPQTVANAPTILARRLMFYSDLKSTQSTEQFIQKNKLSFELVDKLSTKDNIISVRSYQAFCNNECLLGDDQGIYFFDGHHLSMYGARKLVPLYMAALSDRNSH